MATRKTEPFTPGQIHAIPLFASDIMPNVRFTKKDFVGENKRFCFMRIISNEGGAGLIIEVFDLVGSLSTKIEAIENADRLFPPVAISSLPISKKRWQKIGHTDDYDRERDSGYSKICLVLSPFDHPQLWKGGTKIAISPDDVGAYEEWKMWRAHQLEQRIIEAVGDRALGPE